MQTRDQDDIEIDRGGEHVTADIRHRDAGVSRSIIVNVYDRKDGTYNISFVPDVAGKLVLSVNVKGQPISVSIYSNVSAAVSTLVLRFSILTIYHCLRYYYSFTDIQHKTNSNDYKNDYIVYSNKDC